MPTVVREDFLRQLNIAKQALITSRPFLPILSCFCFEGERVTSYNDYLAIQVELGLNLEFTGGVNGEDLLAFLGAIGSKEASITIKGETFTLKGGTSELKLPVINKDMFLFQPPNFPKKTSTEIALTTEWIDGLKFCLIPTAEADIHQPELKGMTFCPTGKKIEIYSTNRNRLNFVTIPFDCGEMKYTCLPQEFLHLTLGSMKEKEEPVLLISKMNIASALESCLIFSSMIEVKQDQLLPYQTLVKQLTAKPGTRFKIPEGLADSMRRARIITGDDVQSHVSASASGGRITFQASSPRGEFKEVCSWPSKDKMEFKINPVQLLDSINGCSEMAVQKLAITLYGEKRGMTRFLSLEQTEGE